jgi:Predicted transcription factor, homolog of eukaryotic MBF1
MSIAFKKKFVYHIQNMSSDFGQNLKKIRKRKKFTQKELADELEFTHNQVSDWETGRSVPNIEQVYKIAKFLKIKIDDLITKD